MERVVSSFQSSLVSHSSSTITNDLLGTDHTEFFTKIRGSLESAFVRHRWNFAKAYWPLFREMCDSTLTAFSVDLRYSYQQVFWMQPRSPPRKQSVPWSTRLRRSNSKQNMLCFAWGRGHHRCHNFSTLPSFRINPAAKQSCWKKFCSSINFYP